MEPLLPAQTETLPQDNPSPTPSPNKGKGSVSVPRTDTRGEFQNLKSNADNVFSQIENMPPPPPPPQMGQLPDAPIPPKNDPLKQFGSVASAFAAIAGLLTRQPLVASMNGIASAMMSGRQADLEEYDRQMVEWKTNMNAAIRQQEYQNRIYHDILQQRNTTINQKLAQFKAASTLFRDSVAQAAAERADMRMLQMHSGMMSSFERMLAQQGIVEARANGSMAMNYFSHLTPEGQKQFQAWTMTPEFRQDLNNRPALIARLSGFPAKEGSQAAVNKQKAQSVAVDAYKRLKSGETVEYGGYQITPEDFKLSATKPTGLMGSSGKDRALTKMMQRIEGLPDESLQGYAPKPAEEDEGSDTTE